MVSISGVDGLILTYVTMYRTLTYMDKIQIYFPKDELEALRAEAERSGRSVAGLVRDSVRKTLLKPKSSGGPVGLWEGEPKRFSVDHDSIYDET
jgi:hypothetical protein